MTDTTQPAAEAAATTLAESTQVQTPATTTEVANPAPASSPDTEQPAEAAKTEQPRDSEGKFLPNNPRVQRLQETINNLTRQKHDTSREVERLKAEAAELNRQLSQRPDIDPLDEGAQQTETIRRALKTQRLEDTVNQAKALEQQSQNTNHQLVAAQAETLREHIQDIDKIFLPPAQGGPNISHMMAEALARVPNGALVAYHLAQNPHEAVRLCQADPWTVATEIGSISRSLDLPKPVKRVSQAPAPVQTVNGAPGNPAPDLGSLSFKDYERIRNEQELARAR